MNSFAAAPSRLSATNGRRAVSLLASMSKSKSVIAWSAAKRKRSMITAPCSCALSTAIWSASSAATSVLEPAYEEKQHSFLAHAGADGARSSQGRARCPHRAVPVVRELEVRRRDGDIAPYLWPARGDTRAPGLLQKSDRGLPGVWSRGENMILLLDICNTNTHVGIANEKRVLKHTNI